jgi:hypothetical protein
MVNDHKIKIRRISKMSEEQKRLEKALLVFIEKAVSEPSTEEDIRVLPAMALVLIELWTI